MNQIYEDAGKRIKEIRLMRGFTREELAERSLISARFLCEIENGKSGFSAEVLYKLCNSLEVNVDYILRGTFRKEYDQRLEETLQLFEPNQTESLNIILKQIYKML